MTIAPSAPVTYVLCGRGLHEMTPGNVRYHTNGSAMCRACGVGDDRERRERIRSRMTQLVVGFAYLPADPWESRATCRDADPDLFDLAEQGPGVTRDDVTRINWERHREAREYCEVCPVVAQCLGQALVLEDRGTRGGELLTDTDWLNTPKKLLRELGL